MSLRSWPHRRTVLACCVVAYFGVRFAEYVLTIVYPDVRAGVGVSDLTLGVGFTASTVTYALAQLPSGALGDRFGARRVVLAALLGTAVASLLLAGATSGAVLVGAMALLGAVGGAYYSPATALLADRFDATGRAIGVHRLGAQVVGLTGPLVALVGVRYGWRVALASGAAVALPAFVGFALFVRPRGQSVPPESTTALRERLDAGTLRELLSRRPIAVTTAVAALAQFADTAAFSYLPAVLRTYHGLSPTLAGTLFAGYFAVQAAIQVPTGWLSDRVGRDPVVVGTLLSGVAGFCLLVVGDRTAVVTLGVGLVGVGMGWSPAVQSRFLDHLDAEESGHGFGLVRTVYIGFAALCGLVVGGAVTVSGWGLALSTLAGAMALATLVVVVSRVERKW
ncbi:MFS transporter [Halomarina salina]|uniref:MFS transporter n=1 Tax=Halomarina salina TaxID=1872699 RepID=A0ABD5RJ83_9EURY